MRQGLRKAYVRARIRLALALAKPDSTVRATDTGRPHVFVALAADYGNVGDLAITRAQLQFLERAFPDAVVEAIPISRSVGAIKRLRRSIGPDDVLTLIGGGNTGDLYDDIQYLRELFVRELQATPTISFPQTIEFSDSAYGRWAARRAGKVYNRHERLAIMARDSRSQARALELFPRCQVVLAPDIVLTQDASTPARDRAGILMALRSDLEQALDDGSRSAMLAAVREVGPVRNRDTHVGDVQVGPAEASAVLEEFWQDWRSASVVVTDRLHGMIFAVITGTPCVALDSGTGKVSQFFRDWLEEYPGVSLVRQVDAVAVAGIVAGFEGCEATRSGLGDAFARSFTSCQEAVTAP